MPQYCLYKHATEKVWICNSWDENKGYMLEGEKWILIAQGSLGFVDMLYAKLGGWGRDIYHMQEAGYGCLRWPSDTDQYFDVQS